MYYISLKSELTSSVGDQSLGASRELPTQQAAVHRQSNSLTSRDAGEPGESIANQIVVGTRPLDLQGRSLKSDDALPVVETIGLRLSSLLISDAVSSNFLLNSRTAVRQQTFGPSIYDSLILSIENNFAGFDGMPIGVVLRFLEDGPQMRSQLSKYLRALPNNISKTVAENLIRAAIENCDASMVSELLKTGLVTPNDIVCSVDGRRYTAVERSAMLKSFEVTKVLLNAGANVNKTYSTRVNEEGALYFAIQQRRDCSFVDMQLVNMLLNHGAQARVYHAAIAVRRQEPGLIKAIMSRIPPSNHPDAFRSNNLRDSSIMEDAVRLLDSEVATTIIVQIVQACYQTSCGKCSKAYPKCLRESITLAATRGHFRLVAFLVDYVADKDAPLAGAVRSGRKDIIELLLEKGANPDAPECDINKDDGFLTTPFAEAIRANDDELIRLFHELGATTQISEEGRFCAAIYAASEVGNLAYVNELLQMAPGIDGESLNPALCISIRKGYEEVPLTLLKAGANVNLQRVNSSPHPSSALAEALDQKNKTLVLMIMECDVNVQLYSHTPIRSRKESLPTFSTRTIKPMAAAARWGDVSIIKNLLSMGAANDACDGEMAVTVAVRAKNWPLIDFLVENGAQLDVPVDSPTWSPLATAISNKEIDMMRYLLDLGADPSCSKVIKEAVKEGGEILAVVLDALRIRFPRSKKGLGAEALCYAIVTDDVDLIDMLLEARFDINTVVETAECGYTSALGMAVEETSEISLDIIRKLILAGGDPNGIVSSTYTWGIDNAWPRKTVMLQAILTESKPLVELLIDEGADIKRAARLGLKRTPLQQACEVGAMEIVDLFLEKGVDVNEAPALRGGATSLQLCAIKGYCGLAERLLNLGADVHAAPSEVNGRTALDGAAENGRLDMLILLWNAPARERFSAEQCSHAMKLAEENGHIACRDLIRHLDLTSRPFLEQG